MELPNKAKAHISPEKITNYLLSETHAVGKSKARYFGSYGFHSKNFEALKEGLLTIAYNNEIIGTETSAYGTKYTVDGQLETPKGVMIQIRTIWIIEKGYDNPRFVTAYPVE
jgi:hypothetical protein